MAAEYLLFCTAMVSMTTINTLMQTPQHNFFSLVRDPSQTAFDLSPSQPLVSPFASGFLNHTSDQIRDFIAVNLPAQLPGSDLEPGQYAILDARSEADNTVILGHSYIPLFMRDQDEMTYEEHEQWGIECDMNDPPQANDSAWKEWRVSFADAERASTILSFEEDFTMKLYNDAFVAAYSDAEGVFLVEKALEAYVNQSVVEE